MGNQSLTITDVPDERVQVEMAIMGIDYRVVTKERQPDGKWTIRGTEPIREVPQAAAAEAGAAPHGAAPAAPAAMDDVETLARTLWGEGRGGSDAGLEAIATVVMNRLATPGHRFGHTVADVCLQPKQFSCWNRGDPNRAKILALQGSEPRLAECRAIARRAIEGRMRDATSGALHYHHRAILPDWAQGKHPSARVDDHLFYNNVA